MKKVIGLVLIIIFIGAGFYVWKISKKDVEKSSPQIKIETINGTIIENEEDYFILDNEFKIFLDKDVEVDNNEAIMSGQLVKVTYEKNNNRKLAKTITILKNVEIYKDENPLQIGLYTRDNGLKLIKEYSTGIKKKQDIGTFQIFPSNEEYISYKGNYTNFLEAKVNEVGKYNVGYLLKFNLKDGTIIEEQILRPDDMHQYSKYILVYSYDRIKHKNDSFYSHVTESEFDNKIVYSSVKLTASNSIDEVVFPIKLSVFTYDTEDDFDEISKIYRGISIYTINIYNKT